jgi:hypothetical protein
VQGHYHDGYPVPLTGDSVYKEQFIPGFEILANLLKEKGVEVSDSFIPLAHDNSSTLKAGFQNKNNSTFQNNADYYQKKINNQDFSQGEWSIRRRRQNAWD